MCIYENYKLSCITNLWQEFFFLSYRLLLLKYNDMYVYLYLKWVAKLLYMYLYLYLYLKNIQVLVLGLIYIANLLYLFLYLKNIQIHGLKYSRLYLDPNLVFSPEGRRRKERASKWVSKCTYTARQTCCACPAAAHLLIYTHFVMFAGACLFICIHTFRRSLFNNTGR